jgi:hypothetical protein
MGHKGVALPPHVGPPPNIITYLFLARPPYRYCTTCLALGNLSFALFLKFFLKSRLQTVVEPFVAVYKQL